LPYIATTAGWMTAEIGRQPWLVFGLIRTSAGASTHVGVGNSLFTLLGFLGMYTLLSLLWVILVYNHVQHGPNVPDHAAHPQSLTA
jgi:cytochrome d ubiquinol oxidase subunit I